jgi:hypothetical protein
MPLHTWLLLAEAEAALVEVVEALAGILPERRS